MELAPVHAMFPLAAAMLPTLSQALPLAEAAASAPHPLNLLLLCSVFLLLASLIKSLSLVPTARFPHIDRLVALLCLLTMSSFFVRRLALLAADGHISITRFFQFFLAGGICAFITHAACTPIDVVKTRIQTMPGRYNGMVDAFNRIVSEEGSSTLLKGLGATAGGYFLHGAFKYSFYEVFKLFFSADPAQAVKPPLSIAALSGFFAECIACVLLCPMEAIRIRSVSDSSFPTSVMSGLSVLLKAEGLHGWFKGLPAMLLKQVPYTVGQFVSFELAVNIVKRIVFTFVGAQSGSSAVASISSFAGLVAGISAAFISHPGDTILSKINQEESEGSAVQQIIRVARAAGFWGLFVGLLPRLVQVSCMIGGQFLIYDSIKLWCGIVPAAALPTNPLPAVAKAVAANST
ncbi:Mitochondrial carrier [Gracilaria domingensis]|nr:Mitochondrial carrier [Gracilaria domingensis]